jgi:hypothetical protein
MSTPTTPAPTTPAAPAPAAPINPDAPPFARPTPDRTALLAALLVPALTLFTDGGPYAPLALALALALLIATFMHRIPRPHRLVQTIAQLLALTLTLSLLTLYAGPIRHHFGLYITLGGLAFALPQLAWRADPRGAATALAAGLIALMGLARAIDRPHFALAVALYLLAALLSTRFRDPHQPPLRRHPRGALAPLALALALALTILIALGWALPAAEPAVTRALSPYLFGGAGTSGFGEGRIALGESGRITQDDAVKLRIEGPPTDHLRGRVYVDYRGGSWATALIPGQSTTPFHPGEPLRLGAGPIGPALYLEGAADSGLALFAPLGATRLDQGPALTRHEPYGILELPPEMITEPRTWTLRLGDPTTRDLPPPAPPTAPSPAAGSPTSPTSPPNGPPAPPPPANSSKPSSPASPATTPTPSTCPPPPPESTPPGGSSAAPKPATANTSPAPSPCSPAPPATPPA